jgi:uncharacterized membrane protein
MTMMSTARTNLRGRLGVLIARLAGVHGAHGRCGCCLGAGPDGGYSSGADPARRSRRPSVSPQPSSSVRPRTPVPGFLLDRGRYTTFDAPKAGIETDANSINNHGQIVGAYIEDDADATYHGFLRDARGRFTTIDLPGARATVVSRINDRGQVVGFSTSDLTGTSFSGFLRDARGRFTAINRPGAAATLVFDINDRGQLVGVAGNPDPAPSPPPASTAAMGRMA